ncbi:MAG: amino acid ABC transporter permease [Actinobacteria bacterium]|nr:amino acid ABC transporter permease [Actinomycetota bacterium]
MQAKAIERPERGAAWLRSESTTLSLGVLITGILSLALAILGTIAILRINGTQPVPVLVESFKSQELRINLIVAIVGGVIAAVAGGLSYRKMATKVSREEAAAGGILGAQAALVAVGILAFASGDVQTFAVNYMDFAVFDDRGTKLAFLRGAWNTVRLAFTSQALGMILGLILSVFAISRRAVVRAPARIYINVFRGTPLVWQMLFIGIGLPIGLQLDIGSYEAATIALTLNTGAYAAEVFRAGIQSIEKGQLEAARGLGMSYLQSMRFAVIPQAVRRVIPPLMNEFVILIKDTSLVLVLGLTIAQRDLMSVGDQYVGNTFNATYYIATALGYLAISLPLIGLVNFVERRLRSGLVGVSA